MPRPSNRTTKQRLVTQRTNTEKLLKFAKDEGEVREYNSLLGTYLRLLKMIEELPDAEDARLSKAEKSDRSIASILDDGFDEDDDDEEEEDNPPF